MKKTRTKKRLNKKRGSALFTAMAMVFLVGAATSTFYYQGINWAKGTDRFMERTRALELAASGIELARYTLRHSADDCFQEEVALPQDVLFDRISLGSDGVFTVRIIPDSANPYRAIVSSEGTYAPTDTKATIEAKMTCGYLNALSDYTIIAGGNVTFFRTVEFEEGTHPYANIHSNNNLLFLASAEIPEGISLTQGAEVSASLPPDVLDNIPSVVQGNPVTIPPVDFSAFAEATGLLYDGSDTSSATFNADGSVTAGNGQTLLGAMSAPMSGGGNAGGAASSHSYGGFTYSATHGNHPAEWTYNSSGDLLPAVYNFTTDVAIDATLGSSLNQEPTAMYAQGNMCVGSDSHIEGRPEVGNYIAGSIALLVEGDFSFEPNSKDVFSLTGTVLAIGGNAYFRGPVRLEDSAIVANGHIEFHDNVTIAMPSYSGYPIVYNPTNGSEGGMSTAKASEHLFRGFTAYTPPSAPASDNSTPLIPADDTGDAGDVSTDTPPSDTTPPVDETPVDSTPPTDETPVDSKPLAEDERLVVSPTLDTTTTSTTTTTKTTTRSF